MRLHASCAARRDPEQGVLLLGPSGAGKSDLLLRLIDRGFWLVADDQVELCGHEASAPPSLAGLIELRGLGIARLPYLASVRVCLVVRLQRGERLPAPARDENLGVKLISLDPFAASAAMVIERALDGLCGRISFVAGALGSFGDDG